MGRARPILISLLLGLCAGPLPSRALSLPEMAGRVSAQGESRLKRAFAYVRETQPRLLVHPGFQKLYRLALRSPEKLSDKSRKRSLRAREVLTRKGYPGIWEDRKLRQAMRLLLRSKLLDPAAEQEVPEEGSPDPGTQGEPDPLPAPDPEEPSPPEVLPPLPEEELETLRALDRPSLEQEAEAGNAYAQCILGRKLCYQPLEYGDHARGRRWLARALEEGHPEAAFLLSNPFLPARENDPVPREGWEDRLFLAAQWGYPPAQFLLGYLYLNENPRLRQGFPHDPGEAIRWLHPAAEAGYARAQWLYAEALMDGNGVAKDMTEAKLWMDRAEESRQRALGEGQSEEEAGSPRSLLAGLFPKADTSGRKISPAPPRPGPPGRPRLPPKPPRPGLRR